MSVQWNVTELYKRTRIDTRSTGRTWKAGRSGRKPGPEGTRYVILFTWDRQIRRDSRLVAPRGWGGIGRGTGFLLGG